MQLACGPESIETLAGSSRKYSPRTRRFLKATSATSRGYGGPKIVDHLTQPLSSSLSIHTTTAQL